MTSTDITMAPLSTTEETRLAELENVVESGLDTFVKVGNALAEIRDMKLYRQTHSNFAEYLAERWDMGRAHGYRLIEAAKVAEVMSPIGDIANEAQARELMGLDPRQVQDVYTKAMAATSGKLTAKALRAARADVLDGGGVSTAEVIDSMGREEAEEATTEIRQRLDRLFVDLILLATQALSNRVSTAELIGAVTVGMRQAEKSDPEVTAVFAKAVFEPFIDFLIEHGEEITADLAPAVVDPTFKPYTAAEHRTLLDSLTAAVGGTR